MIIVNVNIETISLFEICPINIAVQSLRNIVLLDSKNDTTIINTNSDILIREINLMLLNNKHNIILNYPKLKPENIEIYNNEELLNLDKDGCYEIELMDDVIKDQNDKFSKFFEYID